MLAADEDIGDTALTLGGGNFGLESVLKGGTVTCEAQQAETSAMVTTLLYAAEGRKGRNKERTLFVQLVDLEIRAEVLQRFLGGAAVWAVALAEDHDGVLLDEELGLCLCAGHDGG